MQFDKRVGFVILALAVLLLFIKDYNWLFAIFFCIIGLYLLLIDLAIRMVDNISELVELANQSPDGMFIIDSWAAYMKDPEFIGWQREKNYFGTVLLRGQHRHLVILDCIIGPGHTLIDTNIPISNKLSVSDVRDLLYKKAYHIREGMTMGRVEKWLAKRGLSVESRGKTTGRRSREPEDDYESMVNEGGE